MPITPEPLQWMTHSAPPRIFKPTTRGFQIMKLRQNAGYRAPKEKVKAHSSVYKLSLCKGLAKGHALLTTHLAVNFCSV
jgi:hypothetical protein